MPSNQGVAGSWNLGIKCFPFEPFWTFTSADNQFEPGSLEKLAKASQPNTLTLNSIWPYYQSFSVGEQLVQEVGLFDESIYPIYFEDNDYERRVTNKGFSVLKIDAPVHHDNASTINDSTTPNRNGVSWPSNQAYYQNKCDTNDFSEGRWNLERIRANSWHK
jgi:GT2 family glycosyltransferase